MNLEISFIPYGLIGKFLPGVLPFLEESSKRSNGRSSVDDLIRLIITGQYTLWVVMDEVNNVIYGQFMTEVKEYPSNKMLVIQHVALKPHIMNLIEEKMQTIAERIAKDFKCAGIEYIGRPGWKKYASKFGYKSESIVYQKFLSTE
jgi:hypothetical protein